MNHPPCLARPIGVPRLTVVTYRAYIVGGKTVELCTVGELAKALNRTEAQVTARLSDCDILDDRQLSSTERAGLTRRSRRRDADDR
jgi:hypothetical protein